MASASHNAIPYIPFPYLIFPLHDIPYVLLMSYAQQFNYLYISLVGDLKPYWTPSRNFLKDYFVPMMNSETSF